MEYEEIELIHRDIKPSNIIYAGDNHIRLIDFGAAHVLKAAQVQDTRLLGTRGYAPLSSMDFPRRMYGRISILLALPLSRFFRIKYRDCSTKK